MLMVSASLRSGTGAPATSARERRRRAAVGNIDRKIAIKFWHGDCVIHSFGTSAVGAICHGGDAANLLGEKS